MLSENNKRNEVTIIMGSAPENEAFARMTVAAFLSRFNPTLEEISDIKTAVSEAVTNSIIHGYGGKSGKIHIKYAGGDEEAYIEIKDFGMGIENIEEAMKPMYTSKPELERSGLGFAFMEAFMDEVTVESTPGIGTTVRMKKKIAKAGKSSYASLFLQAYFLSKVCETEESKEFLKEKIELANKLAYGVIKNKFLDEDIRQMIPDDLDFDNMEQ